MDEISQIYSISQRKIDFLERLKKDYIKQTEPGVSSIPSKATAVTNPTFVIRTVDDAISQIIENNHGLPNIISDLRNSLDDVSHPVSTEQHGLIRSLTTLSSFSFGQSNRTS